MYEPVKAADLAVLVGNVEGPLASGVFTQAAPDVALFTVSITDSHAPSLVYVATCFLLGTLVAAHATPESNDIKQALVDGLKELASERFVDELLQIAVLIGEEGEQDSGDIPF